MTDTPVKPGRYICEGCDGECNLIIQAGATTAPWRCPMGTPAETTNARWFHIDEWRKRIRNRGGGYR